jgi:class 3 adenylate cyclase
MFCDQVGFTALSSRLDPEDLSAVIRDYQSRVATTIARFGGFIARYVGDGVLIYFGWPEAREADTERAVRAALAVIAAVGQTPVRMEPLKVRIGIATGLVVVGEPIGTGEARQQTAIGETPNLAARLQGLAGPDSVVIDAATRRQIGGLFDCRDLGSHALKGLPEPLQAWQVVDEANIENRFEALHAGTLTPLIGREEELELLLRRWEQAKDGDGQVVLLSGEPGIGKSRLIAALEERLNNTSHASIRYSCSPHRQDSALHPIVARLEQEAGLARSDTQQARLRKLEAALIPAGTPLGDIALIAGLLSVVVDDRYPRLDFSPPRKKQKTFEALIRWLTNRCGRQPVLMLFEDAHWADASSLELLDKAADALTDLPILLIISFRPEFQTPWVGHAATSISLRRLTQRQAAQLAAQVTVNRVLSPALLERIVTQTDGVPLFIEELTKAVLEGGELSDSDAGPLAVPATLQASLMARLDRLPAAKQVAQIAAVIGRDFTHILLAAVARLPEAQLAQGVDALVASGLAFRRGVPPDAEYTFKHALVRDAAYDSLLRGRRAEIHATIVEEIERDPEIVALQPALLGYHCAQAGLIEKAATYYGLAGERSEERSALTETRSLLDRGLSLAATLPDSSDRRRLEVELLVALARNLHTAKGAIDSEAFLALERAVDLSRALNNTELLTRALCSRWVASQNLGQFNAAARDAQELVGVGEQQSDAKPQIFGHFALACTQFYRGCFAEVLAHGEAARDLHSRNPDAHFDVAFGAAWIDSGWFWTAFSLACLGHLDKASAEISVLAKQVHRLSPFGCALLHSLLGHFARFVTRDLAACRYHADAFASIAEEQGFSQYVTRARYVHAWLKACTGDVEVGIHEMQTASMQMGDHQYRPSYLYLAWADALSFAGRTDDALVALSEGLALSEHTGGAWLDAEMHRRKGELLLTGPEPVHAQHELTWAIDTARGQGAKLFELRAATSLARLLLPQGKRAEARELLAPIYGWFTEGFNMPDLREARGLLAQLD